VHIEFEVGSFSHYKGSKVTRCSAIVERGCRVHYRFRQK